MGAQVLNALVGIWLLLAPAVLGYDGPLAGSHRVLGPLAAGCALVALPEATRTLRWGNVPLGLWLLFAPDLASAVPAASLNGLAAGLLLSLLAPLGGLPAPAARGSGKWRP